jgi:hypothetical protein
MTVELSISSLKLKFPLLFNRLSSLGYEEVAENAMGVSFCEGLPTVVLHFSETEEGALADDKKFQLKASLIYPEDLEYSMEPACSEWELREGPELEPLVEATLAEVEDLCHRVYFSGNNGKNTKA